MSINKKHIFIFILILLFSVSILLYPHIFPKDQIFIEPQTIDTIKIKNGMTGDQISIDDKNSINNIIEWINTDENRTLFIGSVGNGTTYDIDLLYNDERLYDVSFISLDGRGGYHMSIYDVRRGKGWEYKTSDEYALIRYLKELDGINDWLTPGLRM